MIAIVCNTPVQLMRAIYLAMNKAEPVNDAADLYIDSGCPEGEKLCRTIECQGVFSNVFFADINQLGKHPLFGLLYGNKGMSKTIKGKRYKRLIAFNIENVVAQAIYNLNKKEVGFEYHCMEDAPAVYAVYEPHRYKPWHPFWWMRIQQQAFHMSNWWSSCPELIDLPRSFRAAKKRLLPIDTTDEKYLELLNSVFEYKGDDKLDKADVLIMEESHYTDGLMIDNADYKIFSHINTQYPHKSILVKLHPRTREDRFSKTFDVMENSTVPWELCLLNRIHRGTKDLIQIGIICGTMFSDKLMFGAEGKKLILAPVFYELVRASDGGTRRITPQLTEGIEKIRETYEKPEFFIIAGTEEEAFKGLDKLFQIEKQGGN